MSGATRLSSGSLAQLRHIFPYLLGLAAVCWLNFTYFDRFWLPADEGAYAGIVQWIAEGRLPHRDFFSYRPGYDVWINVLAMKVWGYQIVSLRWPVLILSLASTLVVYRLLVPLNRWVRALGVLWWGLLGLPAVPSPSASQYATLILLGSLFLVGRKRPRELSNGVFMAVGLTLGVACCFRQLSPVLLICGLICWALSHEDFSDKENPSLGGRALVALAALAVTWYGTSKSNVFGIAVFGLPAISLAWQAVFRCRPSSRVVQRLVVWVGLGFCSAFAPLLLGYSLVGILPLWFSDVFLRSSSFLNTGFSRSYHLSDVFYEVAGALGSLQSPLQFLQWTVWLVIFGCSLLVALYTYRATAKGIECPAYVFCGPFLAQASLHIEIEIYLLWSIPICILALVYCGSRTLSDKAVLIIGAALAVGFFNSVVGRPTWVRPPKDFALVNWGGRELLAKYEDPVGLWLPVKQAELYHEGVALIQDVTAQGEPIISLPYSAEWYFLSHRPNVTKHTALGLSLVDRSTLAECQKEIEKIGPRVIVFRPRDKYNTPLSQELRQWLEGSYTLARTIQGYEFLVSNGAKELPVSSVPLR